MKNPVQLLSKCAWTRITDIYLRPTISAIYITGTLRTTRLKRSRDILPSVIISSISKYHKHQNNIIFFSMCKIKSDQLLESTRAADHVDRVHRGRTRARLELGRLHDSRMDTRRQVHRHVRSRRDVEFVRRENVQAPSCALRYTHRRREFALASRSRRERVVSKDRAKRSHHRVDRFRGRRRGKKTLVKLSEISKSELYLMILKNDRMLK